MKNIINLIYYLKIKKFNFILYVIITFVLGCISLLSPLLNGNFIDRLIVNKGVNILYLYSLLMISIFILNTFLNLFLNIMYTKMQASATFNLNKAILKHLNSCSLLKTKKYDAIYLTQLINSDCNTFCTFILTKIQEISINLLSFIVPLLILTRLTPYISIIFILFILLYYLILKVFKNKLYEYNKILTEFKSIFFSKLSRILTDIKSIKIQCTEEYIFDILEDDYNELLNKSLNVQVLNWKFISSEQLFSTFLQIILFVICGINLINDNITIGNFTIFLSYFNMILTSIKYFYNLRGNFQNILVSYNRILEFLNYETQKNGYIYIDNVYVISIKDLSFGYSENNLIKFKDVSFKKGNIYCISGKNGTGKTTLIDLLCGLYIEDYLGNISINNQNIGEVNMQFMRKHKISYFEQNFATLDSNIEDNILLLVRDNKEDEIIKINEKLKFFTKDNLYYLISNPKHIKNMSFGEKQKISLLIFFRKDTEIFILDEPTNFLDNTSITSLFNYLSQIKSNKLILIITHNLDFLKEFDQVYNL